MSHARLFAVAAVFLAACGSQAPTTTLGRLSDPKAIAPDAQVLVYASPAEGLRLSYPRDWVPQERFMGTVVALFSPLAGQSDLFSENVNLVTDRLDRPVTVEQYTRASLQPLAQVIAGFELIEEGEGTLAERPARYIKFTGRQGGLELTWLQLLTVEGEQALVLSYTGADQYEDFLGHALWMAGSVEFTAD
ncbi:MAG: hypothetical protein ACRD02_08280 [Acidimicrobiia bacterium]